MFDIGFWELATIALVALLIIGPERLPKFARDAGHLFGKLKHYINTSKAELQRELKIEEMDKLKDRINHVDRLMQEAPDRLKNEAGSVSKHE